MLDYLAEQHQNTPLADAARLIEDAVYRGFEENRIRPMEFGGDMGTRSVTDEVISLVQESGTRANA
jgi:3-isopropylmalate dehydrogenase